MNSPDYLPDFEDFWLVCPKGRRIGKLDAMRAWKRLKPDKEFKDKIIKAMIEHCKYWQQTGTELRYIPHPSRWLNAGRYDDELVAEESSVSKLKLLPLVGKTCSVKNCGMPAVYRNTGGEYDDYRCNNHLPEKVKKLYG